MKTKPAAAAVVAAAVFILLWEMAWYLHATGGSGLLNAIEHLGFWETFKTFFMPQKN